MIDRDDACPYEWAEFNLPQELRTGRAVLSPFGRLAVAARGSDPSAASEWPFGAPSKASSGLGAMLIPGLGLGPIPKL
jgi:hypothetical protein